MSKKVYCTIFAVLVFLSWLSLREPKKINYRFADPCSDPEFAKLVIGTPEFKAARIKAVYVNSGPDSTVDSPRVPLEMVDVFTFSNKRNPYRR